LVQQELVGRLEGWKVMRAIEFFVPYKKSTKPSKPLTFEFMEDLTFVS
jgi:hypothetical protein